MATPSSNPFALTDKPLIDVMTTGYYWVNLDANRTLDWSFSGSTFWDWTPNAAFKSNFKKMFTSISNVADVNFNSLGYYKTGYSTSSYSTGYLKEYNAG